MTTDQLPLTKSDLRFCTMSTLARGVSEICDDENLYQGSRLKIWRKRLSSFNRSTKKFIIIITTIIGVIILKLEAGQVAKACF